jgi:hypothetical protein
MKKQIYKTVLLAVVFCLPSMISIAQVGTSISTYTELNTLVRADLTASYYLTDDIVIPDGTEWLPFAKPADWDGTTVNALGFFSGTFDGRGYSIKNIKITTGSDFSGLFARLVGTVKNLGLENVDITGGLATGGLAGTIYGTSTSYIPAVVIENVFVTGSVKGTTEVGGIAGRNNSNTVNTIKNCYVNATVEATNATGAWAGGIVGCSSSGRRLTIKQVYVAGTVKTTNTDLTNFAGGILGFVFNNHSATIITLDSTVVALSELAGGTNGIILNRGNLVAGTVTLNDNYARNDLGISSTSDGTLVAPAVVLGQDLYQNTLGWDFSSIWSMVDGVSYPTHSWNNLTLNIQPVVEKLKWSIRTMNKGINIITSEKIKITVLDMTGRQIYGVSVVDQIEIPLNKGIYLIRANNSNNETSRKVLVN